MASKAGKKKELSSVAGASSKTEVVTAPSLREFKKYLDTIPGHME